MARCPKCDSPDVYRHTGWSKRRRYICRNCMADLEATHPSGLGPRNIVFAVWVVGISLAIGLARVDSMFVLIGGSLILAVGLWAADGVSDHLVELPRASNPLAEPTPSLARRIWVGLRRRSHSDA